MSDVLPTVIVKLKDDVANVGEHIINVTDFDEAKHERCIKAPPSAAPAAPPAAPPAPIDPLAKLAPNWKDGEPESLKKLAAAVAGRVAETKEQAVAMIDAELAKRAPAAPAAVPPPPPVAPASK